MTMLATICMNSAKMKYGFKINSIFCVKYDAEMGISYS